MISTYLDKNSHFTIIELLRLPCVLYNLLFGYHYVVTMAVLIVGIDTNSNQLILCVENYLFPWFLNGWCTTLAGLVGSYS